MLTGPKPSAISERTAAPVGVTSSASMGLPVTGHPFRSDRAATELLDRIYNAESVLQDMDRQLYGNRSKMEVGEKQPATPRSRASVASRGLSTSYGPTALHKKSLELGMKELEPIKSSLKELTEVTLPELERDLREAGAPPIEGQ